jgi:hypothetical protein
MAGGGVMGQASKKQVQAILRRAAERAEKDNRERGVTTSFADPPFACPPDEKPEEKRENG